MPQLPDLRAKIALDFPNVAAATAQAALLGQVLQRELGGTRGTEIDRSMKQIGVSVEEAGRKVADAGTAYVKWGDTVKTSTLRISSDTARTKADFDELERRTKVLGATLESEFKKGSTAVIKLGADGTASLGKVSRAMTATAAGGAGLGGVFSAIGTAAAGAAVPALISLGGALSPVLALVGALAVALGAAIVAVVAFGVGIAAVSTVIAVALGGIGALGAGIIFLANSTGQVNTPMATLQASLKNMADVLGKQAAPMAAVFLGYLNSLVPAIQTLGQQLLTWFGSRMPAVMIVVAESVILLVGAVRQLGAIWGQVIDYFLVHRDTLLEIFAGLLQFGVGAIQGLVTNLLRLSSWFLERLPLFQPVISQIFGLLGTAVQAVATGFGRLADWVLQNWPAIISTIQTLWDNIRQGWDIVRPLLGDFLIGFQAISPIFDYIKTHAENLKPILVLLGIELGLLALAFLGIVAVSVLVVAAIIGVASIVTTLVNGIKAQLPQAGTQFDALGRAGQQMQHDIGTAFSGIGSALHQLGIIIQAEVRQGGSQFSALGAAAQTAQRDIGRAFAAIGSAAHDMVSGVGSAFSGLGTSIHGGLDSARGVFNNFAHRVNGVLGAFKITIGDIQPFAQGGVVPGYAPGQDIVPALLSPGEGVLTPQTVRGLGGSGAIDLLNRAGSGIHGLGALVANDVGALGSLVGSIAGQCVVAVEKWTGHYFPVAMASQMTRWINSATAAAGEIFVSTLPPFGHTGIVLPGGMALDSNWGLDERVRIHPLRDIPNIAGYIAGIPADLGSLAGLALPSLGDILKTLLSPLTSAAHSAAGLIPEVWARPLANSLIDRLASNIEGRQSGGPVIPGHLYSVGEHGPEFFSPGMAGQIMPSGGGSTARVEALLAEAVSLLRHIDGTPGLDASSASRRYAT